MTIAQVLRIHAQQLLLMFAAVTTVCVLAAVAPMALANVVFAVLFGSLFAHMIVGEIWEVRIALIILFLFIAFVG